MSHLQLCIPKLTLIVINLREFVQLTSSLPLAHVDMGSGGVALDTVSAGNAGNAGNAGKAGKFREA